MPRTRRIQVPGEIHHVIARGLVDLKLFPNSSDYRAFIERLSLVIEESECLCYAWCLMPTHYHLVLRPTETSLDSVMRRINGSYAREYNKRHNRRGYLFADRYKSRIVQDGTYFRELVRYVHLNPLRAGLVTSLTGLSGYLWSGHRGLLGFDTSSWLAVDETLSRFSPRGTGRARHVYRAFLAEGVAHGGSFDSIWEEIRAVAATPGGDSRFGDGSIVGEQEFVREVRERRHAKQRKLKELRANRPPLETLLTTCRTKHGIADAGDLIRGRRPGRRIAREEFCYLAYRRYGYSLSEIADFLGIQSSPVYRLAMAGNERMREHRSSAQ